MSLCTFNDVLALEISTREGKKKDDKGKYQPTGEYYTNLILFPFGNEYPAIMAASLTPPQIQEAQSLIGKKINATLDMRITDYGARYTFVSATSPNKN